MLRPSFAFDFTNGYYDPRLTFARASIGSHSNRDGALSYRPAGAPRFWHNSDTAEASGLLTESGSTNSLLWSEGFDNAAWVKTASTVTVNAGVAPDGNTTADAITATDITANVAQAVAITAGQCVAFSVFAKVNSSSPYVSLALTSGALTVPVWFNIATGTIGLSGAGSGNLILQSAAIRKWGNGWYRCSVLVNTTTITSLTAAFAPCMQSGGAAVSGSSALFWGAMLSQEGNSAASNRVTSYIATTSAAVTRSPETCSLPYAALDPALFYQNEGTYFLDFMLPPGVNASNQPIAGASNSATYATTLSITTAGTNLSLFGSVIYLGSAQTVISDTVAYAPEQPVKVAFRAGSNALAGLCVNGRSLVRAAIPSTSWPWSGSLPTSFQWNSTAQGQAAIPTMTRRFAYYSRMLADTEMQKLTA
jgi:hypothetical protein